jgi:hypothetical protein
MIMVEKSLNLFRKEEPKKHNSLFKHEQPKQEAPPISQELEGTISRLRVLEERYTNVQVELRVTEENMIKRNKKLTTDIKTLTMDITELRKEINEIKDKVLLIIKEMRNSAKREEIKVLQKYIEMWEPMNFVTHKEVEEIIEEKLAKKR